MKQRAVNRIVQPEPYSEEYDRAYVKDDYQRATAHPLQMQAK